jgi:hypothetical protein
MCDSKSAAFVVVMDVELHATASAAAARFVRPCSHFML